MPWENQKLSQNLQRMIFFMANKYSCVKPVVLWLERRLPAQQEWQAGFILVLFPTREMQQVIMNLLV